MATVTQVTVQAAGHGIRRYQQYGGGPLGTLRAYQAFHPDAAIYDVTYRGRTVWMTSKQRAIWHEVSKYWLRGKHDKLERIARLCNCSKATVSRFLRRLDQWRFIDLITFRGRGGGVYVFTRSASEKPKIWTAAARFAARVKLAAEYKRKRYLEAIQPMLDWYRYRHPLPVPPPIMRAPDLQYAYWGDPEQVGNTGATLRDVYGTRSRQR